MRLTKQTNYAVCALIYCAVSDPVLCRVKDIAQAYGISEQFLFKILIPLINQGMMESVRGRRGGVRLGIAADKINVADVIRLTEDNFSLFEETEAGGTISPELTGRYAAALAAALAAFFASLGQYSIADLAADRDKLKHLLGIDAMAAAPARFGLPRRKKAPEPSPKVLSE